jgi:hypothetical protein
MSANGIADVVEGKVRSADKHQWDWHAYLVQKFPKAFPPKKLFEATTTG